MQACCGPDAMLVTKIRIVTKEKMIFALMALESSRRDKIRKHANKCKLWPSVYEGNRPVAEEIVVIREFFKGRWYNR